MRLTFLASSKLSVANYDSLLIGWNAQAVKTGVIFSAGTSQYCLGASARANLITLKTWTITDSGLGACDTTAPVLSPIHIQSDYTNSSYAKIGHIITLSYTSDDVPTTQTVTISGQTVTPSCTGTGPVNCTATLTVTIPVPTADGLVAFSITATSAGGTTGPKTATTDSSSVTVDRVAPSVSVTSVSGDTSAPYTTTDTTPDIVVATSVGDTVTIPGFTCTPSPATSASVTCTRIAAYSAPSTQTAVVSITDPAGNTGTTTVSFDIAAAPATPTSTPDMTAATDTGSSNTDNLTNNTKPDFTMTCTTGNTVTVYVDGVAAGTGTCAGGTITITSTVALTDGAHSVTYTESNWVGESAQSPALSVTVDTAAPSLSITSVGGDATAPYATTSSTPSIVVTTAVGDTVSAPGFTCTPSPAVGSSVTCVPDVAYSDGPHSVTVTITDGAGNSSSGLVSFIIDSTPPTITITAPTKLKNSSITDTTIRVTDNTGVNASDVVIAPTGSTAGTSGFSCVQTSATQVDCVVTITSSGDLNIQATDTFGNSATKKETAYVVDTTAPVFSSATVDVVTHGINQPVLNFAGTDNIAVDHYEILYIADNGAAGVSGSTTTMNPATSPATLTLDPDEVVHTITIRVYDTAGNYTEHVIKFPPIVNFTAPTTLSNVAINTSTVTVTSPMGNALTGITLNAGTTGASLGTCTGAGGDTTDPYESPVTCVINNVSSTGSVTVNATDSVTGAIGQNSQSYVIDITAPVIDITAPTKLNNASITDTTITITDDVALLAADVTVSGSTTATTSNFSCTQTNATRVDCTIHIDASGNLVIAVADKAGNTATKTEAAYVIDTTAPVVTIGSLPVVNVSNQSSYVVSGTCTNGDGVVTVAINGVDHTASCSGGSWSVTVDLSALPDGATALTVSASQTDAAGNTGVAAPKTVTKDTLPPSITLTPLTTNNPSPALTGSVNDPTAIIKVTVNGTEYTATNNGNGTWSLPAGTIAPALSEGTYDIIVTATDTVGNTSTDPSTNELTIDSTVPTGTITPVTPSITNSPALSGTVSDPAATVIVTINGTDYTATNNGDGTWSLPAGTIAPALSVGDHTATVTFSDAAGNTSTQSTSLTIQRPDADVPTVDPVNWIGGTPIITGTYDAANSQSLTITVNGVGYVLGTSSHLSADGNYWRLDLSQLSPALPEGSYNVTVQATTRDGSVLGDSTASELKIIAATIPNVISNPTANVTLANTGVAVWIVEVMGVGIVGTSWAILRKTMRKRKA